MRRLPLLLPAFAPLLLTLPAVTHAQEIVSQYTDLDTSVHCSTFASAEEGDGDWANLACSGYRGYPVLLYYGDARESVFYGFPPDGDLAPVWESFGGFNSTGSKIEWRIARDEAGRETPFATIHRWFVETGSGRPVEVLVVEKVGQIAEREGCAVGYVMATGNPGANEAARRIADDAVRGFNCGDDPLVEEGTVPMPSFAREER